MSPRFASSVGGADVVVAIVATVSKSRLSILIRLIVVVDGVGTIGLSKMKYSSSRTVNMLPALLLSSPVDWE